MNLQAVAFTAAIMLATTPPAIAGLACNIHSGSNTTALIELYTSEGCSSCPPADRQLSQLASALEPSAAVVALALHVGYWDYLGWPDRFAQERFAQRQDWLVHANDQRTVYTPQFLVGGSEFQAWQGSLRDIVRRLNTKPALATINLHTTLSPDNVLTLDAVATAQGGDDSTVLYLAIAENGLVTRVMGGENKDATLAHDHVVREWLGPFRLRQGTIRAKREVRLPAGWQRDRLETIAFVQDERSGLVLQALSTASCTDT
ncbi:MAG: DUF1223 domain-containing protein [Thiobacillaceae bacterium]